MIVEDIYAVRLVESMNDLDGLVNLVYGIISSWC